MVGKRAERLDRKGHDGEPVRHEERPTVPIPEALVAELARLGERDGTLPPASPAAGEGTHGVELRKMRERYVSGELRLPTELPTDLEDLPSDVRVSGIVEAASDDSTRSVTRSGFSVDALEDGWETPADE